MTDREIKQMLAGAYSLPETQSGRRFVRSQEKRSLQIGDILRLEFRYMGLQSVLAGVILCAFFLLLLKTLEDDTVWMVSALIPICAIVPMEFLSRSERCGMEELEAASRFSLRFVRLVRMGIIGLFTMGLFLGIGLILRSLSAASGMDYLIFVVTPYLVSDFGSLLITRHWHGKESILGIFAVCVFGSAVPFGIRAVRAAGWMPDMVIIAAVILLLAAVLWECSLYVRESENVSWNLC